MVVELTSVSFVSLLFPGDLFSLFSDVVAAVVLLDVTLLQEIMLFVSVQLILGKFYEQTSQGKQDQSFSAACLTAPCPSHKKNFDIKL